MNKDRINHNALTHLVEAGAVSIANAKAMGDTWALTVLVGDTKKVVMAKNSGKPRVWRKLDTLAKYLKDLGMDNFTIDVSDYDPTKKSLRRPDSANTLKQTHKAHQSLQKAGQIPGLTPASPEPEVRVNIQPEEPQIETQATVETDEITDPIKLNATDKAIQQAKERWEHRRAKILQESDPRAK